MFHLYFVTKTHGAPLKQSVVLWCSQTKASVMKCSVSSLTSTITLELRFTHGSWWGAFRGDGFWAHTYPIRKKHQLFMVLRTVFFCLCLKHDLYWLFKKIVHSLLFVSARSEGLFTPRLMFGLKINLNERLLKHLFRLSRTLATDFFFFSGQEGVKAWTDQFESLVWKFHMQFFCSDKCVKNNKLTENANSHSGSRWCL